MSILLMSQVWEKCVEVKDAKLLVLLALADHANDQGKCWPSIPRLAQRARVSERWVIEALKQLEAEGYIQTEKKTGRANTYTVTPEAHFTREVSAPVNPASPPPVKSTSPTPEVGFTQTVIEPSEEPSLPLPGLDVPKLQGRTDKVAQARDFERFWEYYPRKVNKEHARTKWLLAVKATGGHHTGVLIDGARHVREMFDQDKRPVAEKIKFVPHPATWLHQKRWMDTEPEAPAATPGAPAVPASTSAVRYEAHPGTRLTDAERAEALRRWPDPTGWGDISREHAQQMIDERTEDMGQ